uniref:MIF4G domain-containing protein n=1 Tax=Anopheles atroparvus TaxID=41427 RepID=A0AAG5DN38_ANOAO
MDMHQSSQSSLVQHRFAAAQGGVEPGGGGGGGGFDYPQQYGNNGAVPNGNNDPGKMSAVQNRLSNMRIGSGGGGGGGGGGGMSRGDNNGKETSDLQSFALDYLTEVIAELFDNPGMFEDVKQKLFSMFTDFRDDHYVLSNAVEMIFEQSIKESNFRYMGARLCQLLDSLDNRPESLMRDLLLLKMDDQQSELPNYMKQEQVKVRGTTLFLAELYMQLRSPQHKLGQEIARHIIHAIGNLLIKEGPENLKCICQCLKLCGYELEQDCCEDVHRILGKLQQSQSSSQSSVSNLIKSVLDLQSKSWGREIVPVAPMPAMPNMMGGGAVLAMGGGGLEVNDSPVFYGPDGEILTEEENSFLETNMINMPNDASNGYDDDEELFDDMNPEEVNLAYKDFLQSVPNEQQQQH